MAYIGVVPGYGADYKNQAEVRKAWAEGKDFRITDYGPNDGRYVSVRDVGVYVAPGTTIVVRYGRGLKTMNIKV